MSNMNDWQKYIHGLLDSYTEKELSVIFEVSQPTVNAWRNGINIPYESKQDRLRNRIKASINQVKEEPVAYTVSAHEVPVISWATAGEAHEYSGIPHHWQEKISSNVPKNQKALGIQIVGDSMEPRHYDGQVAIVLPEERARNGDLVIAHIRNIGIVFKKFQFNGDPRKPIVRLSSFNPEYPPMEYQEKDFFWIWPVAEVISRYRRF